MERLHINLQRLLSERKLPPGWLLTALGKDPFADTASLTLGDLRIIASLLRCKISDLFAD